LCYGSNGVGEEVAAAEVEFRATDKVVDNDML
jgi:hypothetical protein